MRGSTREFANIRGADIEALITRIPTKRALKLWKQPSTSWMPALSCSPAQPSPSSTLRKDLRPERFGLD